MTFVALALDHSRVLRSPTGELHADGVTVIANMIFIPTAILYGHPEITTSFYIWKSMIPTLLGNLIGGGIMVAIPYWYLYLFQEETEVVFNLGAVHSGVAENAGPTPLSPPSTRHVLLGRELNESHPASQLPHSEAGFQSAVSRELSEDKYGKKRDAEKDEEKSDSERTNVS